MSIAIAKEVAVQLLSNAPATGIEKIKIAKAIKDKLGLQDWATPFGYIKKLEEEGQLHSKDFCYPGAKPVYTPGGGGQRFPKPNIAPEAMAKFKQQVLDHLATKPDGKDFKDILTRTVETRAAMNAAIQELKEEGKIVFAGKDDAGSWYIALRRTTRTPAVPDPVDPSQPKTSGMKSQDDLPF
jgi:hypothetical protein